MPRRRSSRRDVKPELFPPAASLQVPCAWIFAGLFLSLQGMVILYGGTRFWASAPFLLLQLLLTAGLGVLLFWKGRDEPGVLHLSIEFWALFFASCYAVIRAAAGSAVPFESWTEAYLLMCGALLWLGCLRLGSSKHLFLVCILGFLACCTLHSMWAVVQHVSGDRSVLWLERPVHYHMRASGTFFCPNHFGFMLQMGVILALGVLLMPRTRFSIRVFAGYAWVLMMAALFLTLSRAALLGAFAGMGMVLLLSPLRSRLRRLLSVGAGAVILFSAVMGVLFRVSDPFRERFRDFGTNNIRWGMIWPDTLSMIRGEGLWGSGPGTYTHVFDVYRENFTSSWLYLEYAHNEYLHVLAEYGWIPAVCLLGAVLVSCVRLFRASWRLGPGSKAGMIPTLMLGLWTGALVQAVFDFQFHITALSLCFIMLMATLHGAASVRGCWTSRGMSGLPVRWIFGAAALLSLCLIWPTVHLMVGSYHGYQVRLAGEAREPDRAVRHSAAQRSWLPGWYQGWRSLGLEKRTAAFWMRDPEKKAGLIEESRAAYLHALKLNPYDRISRAGLVELYKMERRWELALEELSRLKHLAPFDVQVRIQEGLALKRMGRTREALEVFREAKRLRKGADRQIDLNIRQLRRKLEEAPSAGILVPLGLTGPGVA